MSHYADYRILGSRCKQVFDSRDAAALRDLLSETPKYRFVIDQVEHRGKSSRLLEMGCSRGYLTSYFLLQGYDIIGVDVSAEAVAAARSAFGEHFVVGTEAILGGQQFDVIYHVGVIGCVADPVGLTRRLLARLKPGGTLLFNAPNRAALYQLGQLWFDSAPPPDLVTIFPAGFWTRLFSSDADVAERVEQLTASRSFPIGLRRVCTRAWRPPIRKPLASNDDGGHSWSHRSSAAWRLFERVATKAARVSGLERLASPCASEFGLFVEMTAR
jgi:SAM-dependent methyltransferase